MDNSKQSKIKRRTWLQTVGAGATFGIAGCSGGGGGGSGGDGGGGGDGSGGDGGGATKGSGSSGVDTIQVAEILPLSGPWADLGQLSIKGGKFAAKRINENGGIKSLGGAEIEIVPADTEGSVDKATTAAQDVISNNNLTAAMGSWLSSFTIGVSGITEREGIPLLTQSYSDKLVNQGYKYIFKFSPLGSSFAQHTATKAKELASGAGVDLKQVAVVRDNTAASEAFAKGFKNAAPNANLEVTLNKVWTPPLSDATPIVEPLTEEQPGLIIWGATATPDAIAIRKKMAELNVAEIPMWGIGTWSVNPPFWKAMKSNPQLTKNLMAIESSHMIKGTEGLVKEFHNEYPDQPFISEDVMNHIGQLYTLKAALEKAGSADPTKVKDALHSLSLTDKNHMAVKAFPVDKIEFKENGLLKGKPFVIPQWQNAADTDYVFSEWAPFAVSPKDLAQREVNWPTK